MPTAAAHHDLLAGSSQVKENHVPYAKDHKQPDPEKTRLTLEMNAEMRDVFEALVRDYKGASKAEVVRKAILLLKEVRLAYERGEELAFVRGNHITSRVIGIGL